MADIKVADIAGCFVVHASEYSLVRKYDCAIFLKLCGINFWLL
jgi:hypothetical protein